MIPKTIHHIVGPKTNKLVDDCLSSWEILTEAGFKIKKWNDAAIEQFIAKEHPFALQSFLNARNHAEAADIGRYLIIYTFGGFYVDWDIQLLDPLSFLELANKYNKGYLLIDPPNSTLASEYFCAEKKDPFLLHLSQEIASIYERGERDILNTPEFSGPFRMRDCLQNQPDTRMICVPVKEVFAYDYREIRNPPKGPVHQPMIHYWMHSWVNLSEIQH